MFKPIKNLPLIKNLPDGHYTNVSIVTAGKPKRKSRPQPNRKRIEYSQHLKIVEAVKQEFASQDNTLTKEWKYVFDGLELEIKVLKEAHAAQIESMIQSETISKEFLGEKVATNGKLKFEIMALKSAQNTDAQIITSYSRSCKNKDGQIEAWQIWGWISAIVIVCETLRLILG